MTVVPAAFDWRPAAACRNIDPGVFFPQRGESTRDAKAICDGCPVREACLEHALVNGERFGVWGGLSERQRRRLRRWRITIAACGTESGYYRHVKRLREVPCADCVRAHRDAERVRYAARVASGVPAHSPRSLQLRRARTHEFRMAGWCWPCASGDHKRCRGECACDRHVAEAS